MRAKSPPKTPGSSVYPTPRLFPGPFSTSCAARHDGRMWRDRDRTQRWRGARQEKLRDAVHARAWAGAEGGGRPSGTGMKRCSQTPHLLFRLSKISQASSGL
jgi:hypothetical protein